MPELPDVETFKRRFDDDALGKTVKSIDRIDESILEGDESDGHPRVSFALGDGRRLVFDCQRKLGELRLIEDPDAFINDNDLGPDALSDDIDEASFQSLLENYRGGAKTLLMKQEAVAGIGNVYSDEILFQAGVHPKRKASTLDEDEASRLFDVMKKVLKTAIDAGAEPDELPDDYLIPRQGDDETCPRCGKKIKTMKVNGRTSYICSTCQKYK